jgi:hypothetical protein
LKLEVVRRSEIGSVSGLRWEITHGITLCPLSCLRERIGFPGNSILHDDVIISQGESEKAVIIIAMGI